MEIMFSPSRLVISKQETPCNVDTFLNRNAQKSMDNRPRKPIHLSGSLKPPP